MPMRNSMRLSAPIPALRSGLACCTAHRIDDAGKLDQQAVAGGLDDAAVMLGDLRIEKLAAQHLEALKGAFLVRPHQPRIPRDIGGEDRSEATLCANRPLRLHGASLLAGNPTSTGARYALSKRVPGL